jgi:hypothetical protein
MDIIIALQAPVSMLVGIDTFLDEPDMGFKQVVIHLLIISVYFRYDFEEE